VRRNFFFYSWRLFLFNLVFSFYEEIFYSDDQANIEDYVSNAIEIINTKLIKQAFQFEYFILKVGYTDSYKMSKYCKYSDLEYVERVFFSLFFKKYVEI